MNTPYVCGSLSKIERDIANDNKAAEAAWS